MEILFRLIAELIVTIEKLIKNVIIAFTIIVTLLLCSLFMNIVNLFF